MATSSNTARSNKHVDRLLKSIRQKVANNPLSLRAHNKVNHMTKAELADFMGVRPERVLTNLSLVGTKSILKTEEFVVGEKFLHREKAKTGIQTYIYDGFRDRIINPLRDRKVKLSKNRRLDKLPLLKALHDTEMQAEVGHKPFKVLEFIPILLSMLSEQKKGEEGSLLTNGYANIFHVQLEDGSVVAAAAFWRGGGWDLDAYTLGHNFRWRAGCCLFIPATT